MSNVGTRDAKDWRPWEASQLWACDGERSGNAALPRQEVSAPSSADRGR